MVGMFGQKALLGQANGPDVELIVSGTEYYAIYETLDGYSAVYDESRGLFCYARLANGKFESTGISIASPPPKGLELHMAESDSVRLQKIEQRTRQLERRSQARPQED